jgi:hypothetical protein
MEKNKTQTSGHSFVTLKGLLIDDIAPVDQVGVTEKITA